MRGFILPTPEESSLATNLEEVEDEEQFR